MEALLTVVVVLNSLILLGVIIGLLLVIRKVGRTADAAEVTLREVGREIGPTMKNLQVTLNSVGSLAAKVEQELSRVDGVFASADKIVSGVAVAGAAIKAVRGSKLTAVGILTGVTEGLRVLRSRAGNKKKEES